MNPNFSSRSPQGPQPVYFAPFANRTPPLQPMVVQERPPFPVHAPFHGQPRGERVMYKSTIQPSTSSQPPFAGFSKLQAMGRFIKEQPEQPKHVDNPSLNQPSKPAPLAFRQQRPDRPKMASSVIFFNKNSDSTHHFGYQNQQNRGMPSGFDALMSKARTVKEEEVEQSNTDRKQQRNGGQQRGTQSHRQNVPLNGQQQRPFNQINPAQGSPFAGQLGQKNGKQFQFHRRPSTGMVTSSGNPQFLNGFAANNNQQFPSKESEKNNTNVTPMKNIPVSQKPPTLSPQTSQPSQASRTVQQEHGAPLKENEGMFKKKNAYSNPNDHGKTDQKLLQMLGIAKSPQNPTVSPTNQQQAHFIDPSTSSIPSLSTQKPSQENVAPRKFSKADFNIGKKMGKGQFGEVMLVQHKLTGFICGLKVMNKREIKLQKYENQIARQLSIQFYLSHRNVAPLYGYFEDEQNIYLLVEFCSDGQLLEMLRKNRRMKESDVSPIIREICEGLDYVHKEEIIHRDVKPENILFNFGTVKISDFGWAVHCGTGMRRTISGSPLYYSPQVVNQTAYDEKIDIWSIGMMTYQCLIGKIPFKVYSELDLNRIVSDQITFPEYVDVSDQAKDFILRIMKKKPEDRMDMRQILRHPFITKYFREKKVSSSILEEFRSVLKL